MPPGQQIAFQPPFQRRLTEDFHDPPVRREMVIIGGALRLPGPVCDLQNGVQAIGVVLVGG